mgnify:CR=1 FL=1
MPGEIPPPSRSSEAVTRGDVARGAGLAGLARLGAVIEAVAQPAYIWMFGVATYGVYVVLWGAVSLASNLLDLSVTSALQRVVPTRGGEGEVHGAVKIALLAALIPTTLLALIVCLNASVVAGLFSAAPEDAARLPQAVAIFVWALPLWTFVEVATSAARARRAFGPEIRLRIFWEQVARLVFALGFFLLGFQSIGLMLAHLCSLALTAALCVRLLGRYYDLTLLLRAPVSASLARTLLGTGLALLPADMARRLLIDAPPVALNLILPGAQGAASAGLFEIARKISTIPNIVRQAFRYVLAPLSAAQAHADRAQIGPLYRFACRVSAALVIPLAGALIFAGRDILSVYRPEAMAALAPLVVLAAARAVEAVVGPASEVVEMTGHRGLPLLNSVAGIGLGVVLAALLVPGMGALGMAWAVAAAMIVSAAAATLELGFSDRLSPFDSWLARTLLIAAAGLALMAAAEWAFAGPLRFIAVVLVWLAATWLALRFALPREDRAALGGLSRRLRLI